ncbi:MAG: hypothetical protein Q7R61_01385 [bacterium]|nr:hypothetical protein [bacterium]
MRLGFLASLLFAVFWTTWHLLGYQVPAYTTLKITDTLSYNFASNRWWDIIFAFSIVNVSAYIARGYYKLALKFTDKDIIFSLVFGSAIGFTTGSVSLTFGLILSLICSLAFGIAKGLDTDLVAGVAIGVAVGLGSVFGLAVGIGLKAGLAVGLIIVLAAGLIIVLCTGLAVVLAFLFSRNLWEKTYQWFSAQDIN